MATNAYQTGDYGLDAPPVVRNLLIAAACSLIAGLILGRILAPIQPTLAMVFRWWGILAGASMLLAVGMMVWSSRSGKLAMRERLLDSLHLEGTETVLDVGCGRGLLLNAAARRLTNGKAIGVDMWQGEDQSGNRMEATLANARLEGVVDRVEVKTGDMRALPVADLTADAVISSMAIHNVREASGRRKALAEIARVLKPGGRLVLLDFMYVQANAAYFRDLGWREVNVSPLSFRMFPPVRVVRGRKPV